MRTLAFTFVMALGAATQLGATHCGEITDDAGFDLWCGTSLCRWNLERGSVENVPTWNVGDRAVQLWGNTAIEQFEQNTSQDGTCIEFDVLANVSDGQAVINIDVNSDGSVEESIQIPRADWEPLTYTFAVTAPFSGMRIELATTGENSVATFARMSAHIADNADCAGLTPLAGGPEPDGAFCATAADCASPYCVTISDPASSFPVGACASCDPDHPSSTCAATELCAVADAPDHLPGPIYGCEAPGARALGAQCDASAECESGICDNGWCSVCDTAHPCAAGTCGTGYANTIGGPQVCGVRSGAVASGQPCVEHEDCASGTCTGTPSQRCDNSGHRCASNGDCVVGDDYGFCVTVGVEGGSCQ